MGCTCVTANPRKETICLYQGKVIHISPRPEMWERLCNEIRRVIGRETMEVSLIHPDRQVSQVTATTWSTIFPTSSRLILVVSSESQEETMNLEMTGKRKRDRKYSQISRILTEMKRDMQEFDQKCREWMELTGCRTFEDALKVTYAQGSGYTYLTDFPYIKCASSSNSIWEIWVSVLSQVSKLDSIISQTRVEIDQVANQRTIKQLDVFRKTEIDTCIAKAQENNVKMTRAREMLKVYGRNVREVKERVRELAEDLQRKQTGREEGGTEEVGKYLLLCL